MRYWLGLGANLGARATNLAEAIRRLTAVDGLGAKLARASSVYETEPVGVTDQPAFLNMVVEVEAAAEPEGLLAALLGVERDMGRLRDVRWGPRLIDLDILLCDGPPVASGDLEVPHPRLAERQFVLVPLAEIAADLVLRDGRRAGEAATPGEAGVVRAGTLVEIVRRQVAEDGG